MNVKMMSDNTAVNTANVHMAMVPYNPRIPVAISFLYVCGNLHRMFFAPLVLKADGRWTEYRNHRFDSMTEAVVWAIAEGRPIVNWNDCVGELSLEDECRQEWEQWFREERVRQVLPAVPLMIQYSAGE